jgi:ribosomal protein S18 acetylase RimI-like enzyme
MSRSNKPPSNEFVIATGLTDDHRIIAADLYWDAFGSKLGKLMGPSEKAKQFFAANFDETHALSAYAPGGELLGIAGFKTQEGAFLGGGLSDLMAVYGPFGALWRAPLLDLLERDLEDDVLLMDGICVAETARGMGVGSALLEAVCNEAQVRRLGDVRLDVIDTNIRAHALYVRKGFVEKSVTQLGPLSWFFGFSSATTMIRSVRVISEM